MKRSKPLRRSRIRAVGRKPDVKELDRLARAVVFARDGNRCVKTGRTDNLQWAHVVSRRYRSTRWLPENALVLNAGVHLWAHHQPLDFAEWFKTTYPERAAKIKAMSQTKQKVDTGLVKIFLEGELRRLTGSPGPASTSA